MNGMSIFPALAGLPCESRRTLLMEYFHFPFRISRAFPSGINPNEPFYSCLLNSEFDS